MNSKSIRALNLLAGEPLARDMTLRDWFAGQALAGIRADSRLIDVGYWDCSRQAYKQADEMLAAREEK